MLHKIKNNRGFTIIETLIVLAIAGLIILIVLLAVPALDRTSHNTNLKNDATTVASQISDFESNNNGALPTCVTNSTTAAAACAASANNSTVTVESTTSGAISSTATVQASDVITSLGGTGGTALPGTIPTLGSTGGGLSAAKSGVITVYIGYSCTNNTLAVQGRSAAVVYAVETSGGYASACVSA
jgi:prepilin-type N-terminal cleavage/methylation domain-containing protein